MISVSSPKSRPITVTDRYQSLADMELLIPQSEPSTGAVDYNPFANRFAGVEVLAPSPRFTTVAVDYDPFASGELSLVAPATAAQQEIWASVQMGAAANCAYNEAQSLGLQGSVQVEALVLALQDLVQRHESLRATFSPDGLRLCIAADVNLDCPLIELSDLAEAERQTRWQHLLSQAVETPFDLEHGPLFRVEIVRWSPQDYRVLLVAHHIICDGWSWGVLMPELAQLYSAYVDGSIPTLDDPERFSDYAQSLAAGPDKADIIEAENYWIQQFKSDVPIVDIPTDFPRPPLRTFEAARVDRELSAELVSQLKLFGRRRGCSFITVLLACFEVFLHRLTAQSDLVVGLPAAGQAASDLNSLVGHCVSLLPIRSYVDSSLSFIDHLSQRRSALLDAYDHQQFTFGDLLPKLSIPRDSSRIPLVPITFNVDQGLSSDTLAFSGLTADFSSIPRAYENFEIFLNATELEGKLTLECQYNRNLFEAATIQRRLAEFETLLYGILKDPSQAIATLPLLPRAEAELLSRWNRATPSLLQDKCIHDVFEAQAEQTPDCIAVNLGHEQITYQQLNQRANQLAHYLNRLGVGPDVLVGVCLERSVSLIVSLLGILKAGGAYVPLDPNYPKERLNLMLADANVRVLLTQEHLSASLPTDATQEVIYLNQQWTVIAQEPTINFNSGASPDNLAYVNYTSGSTGKPKGVCVPHRGVTRLVIQPNYVAITPQDVFLQLASVTFDAATFEIWGALLNGARLALYPDSHLELERLGHVLQQESVSILWLTSGLFNLVVEQQLESLKSVKQLLAGGDVLSPHHVQRAQAALPQCTLINGYGPTENTTFTCCHTIPLLSSGVERIPIGRPINNTQVYILNSAMQPVPIGVAGDLYIGGDGLARGYLNRPDLTEQHWVDHPFQPGAKLYTSGDLACYLPDGTIDYLGRRDLQVKIRGFRIELSEIESCLSSHPKVESCVASAQGDSSGQKSLIAYVVPQIWEQPPSLGELKTYLKDHLPSYMIPAHFVTLEELPLNSNGKVNRNAQPPPHLMASGRSEAGSCLTPQTLVQSQLAQIWTDVLKLGSDIEVDITANFFELGGHSLAAADLIGQIRQRLTVSIPLSTLFESPTIVSLAQYIEKEYQQTSSGQWASVIPLQSGGSKRPFFFVPGRDGSEQELTYYAAFLYQLGQSRPIYGIRARGLDGIQAPHQSVEDMARDYVAEIQAIQPEGPYFIGGECIGGIVAFAIAQHLQRSGHTVHLVLLDTSVPNWRQQLEWIWQRHPLIRCGLAVGEKLLMLKRYPHYFKRVYLIIRDTVHSAAPAVASEVPAAKAEEPLPAETARGKLSREVTLRYPMILMKYRPQMYSGSLTLILCQEAMDVEPEWAGLVQGSFNTIQIPGEHHNRFSEYANTTAQALMTHLDEVEAQWAHAG